MSAALLDATLAFVRGAFGPKEVVDVLPYAGEFSAEAIGGVTFVSPAVLVAVLGWGKPRPNDRLSGPGCKVVHMVAFVAVANGKREERAKVAMLIAEKLSMGLARWSPAYQEDAPELAPPEDDVRAENLHNKKLESQGMALWVVVWRQCVNTHTSAAGLVELLGIDITSTVQHMNEAGTEPAETPLSVTHEVAFQTNLQSD